MPSRISQRPAATASRTTSVKPKQLPELALSAAASKKMDQAIGDASKKKATQLKFTMGVGFKAPGTGNQLQTVYLKSSAMKSGLSIAYVDAKGKQFWAQSPGVSGQAKGPFPLPAGIAKDLAVGTKAALAENAAPVPHGRGVRTDGPTLNRGSATRHDSGGRGWAPRGDSGGRGWAPLRGNRGSGIGGNRGSSVGGGGGGGGRPIGS